MEYGRNGASPMSVTLDAIANDGQPGEADNVQAENVTTGEGADTIVGDDAQNTLVALGGPDTIRGLGGNDVIFADAAPGSGMPVRGLVQSLPADDVVDGGAGRDQVDCGTGFDLALHDPVDQLDANCERVGALLAAESAALTGKKKNKAKVAIECPAAEGAPCEGRLAFTANGKQVGKGTFNVPADKTKKAKGKLNKKGLKAIGNAGGSLLVSVTVTTTEPGGVAESAGRILLYQ